MNLFKEVLTEDSMAVSIVNRENINTLIKLLDDIENNDLVNGMPISQGCHTMIRALQSVISAHLASKCLSTTVKYLMNHADEGWELQGIVAHIEKYKDVKDAAPLLVEVINSNIALKSLVINVMCNHFTGIAGVDVMEKIPDKTKSNYNANTVTAYDLADTQLNGDVLFAEIIKLEDEVRNAIVSERNTAEAMSVLRAVAENRSMDQLNQVEVPEFISFKQGPAKEAIRLFSTMLMQVTATMADLKQQNAPTHKIVKSLANIVTVVAVDITVNHVFATLQVLASSALTELSLNFNNYAKTSRSPMVKELFRTGNITENSPLEHLKTMGGNAEMLVALGEMIKTKTKEEIQAVSLDSIERHTDEVVRALMEVVEQEIRTSIPPSDERTEVLKIVDAENRVTRMRPSSVIDVISMIDVQLGYTSENLEKRRTEASVIAEIESTIEDAVNDSASKSKPH